MAAARLSLLAVLRRELAAMGDPERARGQAAYMKSTMPFHGVASQGVRDVSRRVFGDYRFDDPARWRRDLAAIWRGARFREERYAAIALAQDRRARPFHTMEALATFEEMIVTGAWWDYVDSIAAHDLGEILRNERSPMRRAMLGWARCDDLWKRRSAILCQLRFRGETDRELLYACIEPNLDRSDFFLRKAIGWALRQLAWTDPGEVARYVRANEARLSPLSKREALKNVATGAAKVRARGRGKRPAR